MLNAGRLRHRLRIEQPSYTQNQETGDQEISWVILVEVWGEIRPASAREFMAAQAEQSKIIGRITARKRDDVDATMRIVHLGKNGVIKQIYQIEGVLPDPESGEEYMSLPVSAGLRDADDTGQTEVILNVKDADKNVIDQSSNVVDRNI